MKRLLAYLFIVLGLGLVFNNFAFAKCIEGNCRNGQGTATWDGNKYVGEWKDGKYHGQGTRTYPDGKIVKGIWKNGELADPNKIQNQIAKKEKKVAKKQGCIEGKCSTGQGTFIYKSGDKYVGGWKYSERHGQGTYTYADGRIVKGIWKEGNIITKTQIAKKEPKKKEKKKVVKKKEKKKVVKKKVKKYVPEETQEDNIKPKIEIASSFTFKNPEYLLKGKVTDKGGSEKIYLFAQKAKGKEILLNPVVGGKIKQFKNGRFEIERFSLENEEIKLIARDEYRNETIKVVKVNIAMEEETEVASVYDELKPTLKGIRDNKRVAIIIGVESYEKTPAKALYANNDAEMFKNFANRSLGIRLSNIKVLIDSKARKMDIIETLKLWLPKKITPNQTELFVFFSSHGYPSEEGLYLIPQDGDPRLLEESALSHKYIIDRIVKAKPKSVTMFIDACYSGRSKTGKVLVAGLKQIDHVATSEDIPTNFNIFSSSKSNQLSATIKEAEHGIFSYYLMKGLAGEADLNKDKQISNNELFVYLQDSVSQEAFKQNRDQNPILTSQNPDQILMKY